MNSKKEIIAFMQELLQGVTEKRKDLDKKVKKEEAEKYSNVLGDLKSSRDYVSGQEYELGYLLSRITHDKRKKSE